MNKNLLKFAVVLLSVGLIFSGCSKDDDEVSQGFKYDGKTYDLDKGEMISYGEVTEGVYNIDLFLYSNDVQSETMTGNAAYFEIFTNSETDFALGTYDYNSSSEAVYTFDIGHFYMNYDFYNGFRKYKFMLVHQLDAYVFKDDLLYWTKQGYDYIGAPWFEGMDNAGTNASLLPEIGNGGFSLRKIKITDQRFFDTIVIK